MELILLRVCFILALQIEANNGAKILGIFPLPAKSHFTCNNAIMKSLLDAGHEVAVITSFPEQASAQNYSLIMDVSGKHHASVSAGQWKIDQFLSRNVFTAINYRIEVEYPFCSKIFNLPEIQKILKSNETSYDVIFVEIYVLYKCFLPVAEKIKAPVIGTVTLRTWLAADLAIHNPYHPAYVHFEMLPQRKLNHVTGRIINVWNSIVVWWYKTFVFEKLIAKFHENHADQLGSLGKYADMEPDLIFYNNHPSLLPRPMNPIAIDIGGIHTKNSKNLPQNIQRFIDEADYGVILFSLGSIIPAALMSPAMRNAFRAAFAEIPQRVIWKFEEKIQNLSSNVMRLNWTPQHDILGIINHLYESTYMINFFFVVRDVESAIQHFLEGKPVKNHLPNFSEHKNVIAFISHCGLGSTNEAIHTATPLVAFPVFGDQLDNAQMLEDRGVAVYLNFHQIINKQNILSVLNAIVNDTSYYNNMQKLSKQFKDRPMTPQQSVVYWTEYVIRHNGASHLKSPASQLSWFQYFLLDVILIVALILALISYFLNRLFKYVYFYISKYLKMFNKVKNKKH